MSEFKVGDKIVRITNPIDDLEVGTRCEVSRADVGSTCIEIKSKPRLSYHASKFELAPDEIKTVTHKGQVYEIGSVYLFSDDGEEWWLDRLVSINVEESPIFNSVSLFESEGEAWTLIKKSNDSIGTITPAPIELIDGAAYMFDYQGKQLVGLYYNLNCMFYMADSRFSVTNCTNIRLMTVESK